MNGKSIKKIKDIIISTLSGPQGKSYSEKGSEGMSVAHRMSHFLTWRVKLFIYTLCTFLMSVLLPPLKQ